MDREREFYIGEDGLEHCFVCNEPLEVLLPESFQRMFQMKSHPRQCACRREESEKEERERKVREHAHEVEKNTTVCFSERAMKEWNFNNDNGSNPCMSYAKQYVEHWDDVKKKNIEEAASRCAEESEYIAITKEMKAEAPEEETVDIRRRRAR